MDLIQSALYAVSLDDVALPNTVDAFARNKLSFLIHVIQGNTTTERTFCGINGHNRWYDTCLNVIIQNDGRVSVNGEHSPLDALIPAYLFNTVVSKEKPDFPNAPVRSLLAKPFKLEWKVDERVAEALHKGQKRVDATVNDSDLKIVEFPDFGSDYIKQRKYFIPLRMTCSLHTIHTVKVSPDAFVQMALQLTFYRIHKQLTAVYETASTRKYLHGRTETTRSLSIESAAFVKAFDDARASPKTNSARSRPHVRRMWIMSLLRPMVMAVIAISWVWPCVLSQRRLWPCLKTQYMPSLVISACLQAICSLANVWLVLDLEQW